MNMTSIDLKLVKNLNKILVFWKAFLRLSDQSHIILLHYQLQRSRTPYKDDFWYYENEPKRIGVFSQFRTYPPQVEFCHHTCFKAYTNNVRLVAGVVFVESSDCTW